MRPHADTPVLHDLGRVMFPLGASTFSTAKWERSLPPHRWAMKTKSQATRGVFSASAKNSGIWELWPGERV